MQEILLFLLSRLWDKKLCGGGLLAIKFIITD